mgnify:FL=1
MGCSLGVGLHGERKDPEKSIRLEKIQSTAWDAEHVGEKCASDGYWEEAAAGVLYRHPFPAQCWRLGRLAAEIVGGECDYYTKRT